MINCPSAPLSPANMTVPSALATTGVPCSSAISIPRWLVEASSPLSQVIRVIFWNNMIPFYSRRLQPRERPGYKAIRVQMHTHLPWLIWDKYLIPGLGLRLDVTFPSQYCHNIKRKDPSGRFELPHSNKPKKSPYLLS